MKTAILHNRHFQVCAALIAADCLVFTAVDPVNASALWLITGYMLLGLTLLSVAALAASTFKAYGDKTYYVSKRLLRYLAVASIVLIGLQSVGQLTTKDIAAMLPFVVLAYLYFGYGKKLAAQPT